MKQIGCNIKVAS